MNRFERWTVWVSAVATGMTGLGFMWAKYLTTTTEPWAVVNHPLEPWFLKAHIIFAPVFVFAVGLIATRHIAPHIRERVDHGRRSGLAMVWMLVPMTVSGYLIQVVTVPVLVTMLVAVHIVTGLVFLLGLTGHAVALIRKSLEPSAVDARQESPPMSGLQSIVESAASVRHGPARRESGDPN